MNPPASIQWRTWEEGFAQAKKEKKPVLLSLSGVWCHWCHVMDRESFSHPAVSEYLNTHFIPVRVDTDQRPDINTRYNMGGWPTVAVLTRNGAVITGGTYLPPEQFLPLLQHGRTVYDTHADKVDAVFKQKLSQTLERARKQEMVDAKELLEHTLGKLRNAFDGAYGGFGTQPKFPHPEALLLLLEYTRYAPDKGDAAILTQSLDAMASHDLWDGVEGGFFRYCTGQDWSAPHYEKMLEDNAALLSLYSQAFAQFKKSRYQETAKKTARYLLTTLYEKKEGFYASQDADEAYYALEMAGRKKASPPFVDRTVYADLNGMAVCAFFQAGAALQDDTFTSTAQAALEGLLTARYKDGAVQHHAGATVPLLTDHVHLLIALLDAHAFTHQERYRKAAQNVYAYIVTHFRGKDSRLADRIAAQDEPLPLAAPEWPLRENALFITGALRLAALEKDPAYEKQAHAIFEALAGRASRAAFFAAPFARAALALEHGLPWLVEAKA